MRFSCRPSRVSLLLLLAIALPEPTRAAAVRLVAADDGGVTLRLETPAPALTPAGPDGRARLEAGGLEVAGTPGRPHLPFAAALIAIPPGARAAARVVAGGEEELREGVRLTVAPRPVMRHDGGGLGVVPGLEAMPPLADGPWPPSPVEVDEPFSLRRQRVVAIRLHPFRYDETTGRLWSRRTLVVRVDFVGGSAPARTAAEEDRYWEPVLRGTVLNFEQGRRFREPAPGPAGAAEGLFPAGPAGRPRELVALEDSEPEVRVQLDTTGVYALEFAPLRNRGYPANVPLSEVSVHRHEYRHDAVRPYATVELPIEIVDADGDSVFGPGDRILLFVQSWAERSRASFAQRAWGDGEVVYVTRLPGSAGLRMTTRPGWRDLPLTPLASYPWSQRWERNRFHMPVFQPGVTDTNTDQFHWTEIGLFAVADSFRFETNDLDTTRRVRFSLTWQGRKANAHINWAHIRNGSNQFTTVADALEWFGRGSRTQAVTLFGSALSEGNRNVLRTWGQTDRSSDIVNTAVNHFDAVYWRRFRALNGMLPCNSGEAAGAFEIRAEGFVTRDVRVYDVTDSLEPVRLSLPDSLTVPSGGRFAVRFQDSTRAGVARRYVAFDRAKTLPEERYGSVAPARLHERSSGDYLVIVPEAFREAVAPLVELRRSQGLDVVVAPLESVNDEFNGGRRSSYAIRRFIRHAYRNWNARFVLLVGDGSEDPQGFLGSAGRDWVPVQTIAGPVGVFDGASNTEEAIVSDPWYVWCVECPAPRNEIKVHDLFIGRLPVNSVRQTTDLVNKIIAYENVGADQAWRREMLLAADDRYSTTSFFGGGNPGDISYCDRSYERVFLDINQKIRSVILDDAGLSRSNAEIFDLGHELRNVPADPEDPSCRASWNGTQLITQASVTPRMIQKLNAGRLWWNFQGHANPYVLTHEDLYVNRGLNDDKDRLMNDGMPFLFSAFSCHPNAFGTVKENDMQVGPSLGEDMVLLPNRGAIASWASSAFEILPSSPATHLNVHLARALFSDPPRDERLGDRGARVVLGEAIAQTLVRNLTTTNFFLEREVGISYNLLGDPATRVSIGSPQTVVRANGQPVVSGEPVRLFSVGDTLRLEADLASNVSFKAISLERADARETRTIPEDEYTLTPAFPDTVGGGRRYRLVYRTTLEAGSLRYTIRTVDRYDVPSAFDIVFRFLAFLRADGVPLIENDRVRPGVRLALQVVSPTPILQPATDFGVTLDGEIQTFVAAPAGGDTTGREWLLSWTRGPYAPGRHEVTLSVHGEESLTLAFEVVTAMRLESAMAFPNPFDDDLGTHFSFYLASDGPASVLVRVFTVSGRLVYDRTERGLTPGYHQIAWDGRDAEGQKLANGLYLYRLVARDAGGSTMHEGRLVKLRKPRRRTLDEP